jgi:hypothetical protein
MERHDDEDLLTTGDVAGITPRCERTNSRLLALPGGSMSSADHRTEIDAERHRKDRALIARIAASERCGHTGDRSAATAPARRGLRAKFELEADPDGDLPIDERARRADALQRAHMLRLSLASAKARRRKT